MHWHRISERTEYVSVKESLIAVYHLSGNAVVLIDAGAEESPEFVEDILSRGLEVKAILCTHLHFDHISTAGLIYERFGMPSFAHCLEEKEEEFPTRDFPVTPIYDCSPIVIEGESFEVLSLPGHSTGHLGFVTPDGICCVGDAFMSYAPLKAAKIPYFIDVDKSIETMEMIRQTHYKCYLLSHEALVYPHELDGLIDANIDKELLLYDMLRELVTGPVELEQLVTDYMKHCGIRSSFILSFEGYRGTVRSRIMSLAHAGELRVQGQMVIPVKNS